MNHVIYNSRHLFYVCAKFIFLCLDMLSYNDPVFDTNLSSSLQTCDTMRIHMIFTIGFKKQVSGKFHPPWSLDVHKGNVQCWFYRLSKKPTPLNKQATVRCHMWHLILGCLAKDLICPSIDPNAVKVYRSR